VGINVANWSEYVYSKKKWVVAARMSVALAVYLPI